VRRLVHHLSFQPKQKPNRSEEKPEPSCQHRLAAGPRRSHHRFPAGRRQTGTGSRAPVGHPRRAHSTLIPDARGPSFMAKARLVLAPEPGTVLGMRSCIEALKASCRAWRFIWPAFGVGPGCALQRIGNRQEPQDSPGSLTRVACWRKRRVSSPAGPGARPS
jgi:hypothetical protein